MSTRKPPPKSQPQQAANQAGEERPTHGEAKRPRGRPKGTGKGPVTRRYNISLPLDLADFLDTQESPSATIARALQEMIDRDSRR